MNVQRKIILTVSLVDILRGLKADNDNDLHVAAMPADGKGVTVEALKSGGVVLTWTTAIGSRE